MKFKINTAIIAGILSLLLFIGGGKAYSAVNNLTEKDINKMIHNYIMENPHVILQSVEKYQREGASKKRESAIKRNKEYLFSNKNTPVVGNPNGDVTVVEFLDYNCGFCKRVWPNVEKLLKNDPNVKFLFKEYPILGPSSEMAARWALAAHKQGKYFDFHKNLIESRGAITEEKLTKIAKKLDLNIVKLKQDVNSSEITETLQKNRNLALELEITGTPGFVIEDTVIPGAASYEQLRNIVKEKRKEKK